MKQFAFSIALLFTSFFGLSQGQFLLIGGGSEEYGDWSDAPYKWAIDQAAPNKRVAVLTYSSSTNWIPDYLKSLGATEAKIFKITTLAQANEQALYDSLLTYSVVFIKGGDQSNYYKFWKQTRLAEALFDIYQKGGTLVGTSAGMAILAPVSYVALNNTVYPDESIKDPFDPNITLADDFFAAAKNPWPTAWGRFIFETHTAERGRFARLPAFMGHWFLKTGESVRGLAVDDQTALAVEKTGKATVMGSGSATYSWFYGDQASFSNAAMMLEMEHLRAYQLLDGMSFDFSKPKPTGASQLDFGSSGNPNVAKTEVFGNTVAYLSSAEDVATTAVLASELKKEALPTDHFVILDFGGAADPTAFQADLMTNAIGNISYYLIDAAAGNILSLKDAIQSSQKTWWCFIGNDFQNASDFWYSSQNGQLLQARSNQNGANPNHFVFIGPSSEWAGRSVCRECHTVGLAAWNGELTFSRGLEVVNSAVVMADTWDYSTSDFYENTANAVPFSMLKDTADTGIWLNGQTIARYETGVNDCFHELKMIAGEHPIVFFDRGDNPFDFASTLLLNHTKPRQIGGFWEMKMSLIGPSKSHFYNGCILSTDNAADTFFEVKISPNPTTDLLSVFCDNYDRAMLFDNAGRFLGQHRSNTISVQKLVSGNYFLQVFEKGLSKSRVISFIKN